MPERSRLGDQLHRGDLDMLVPYVRKPDYAR